MRTALHALALLIALTGLGCSWGEVSIGAGGDTAGPTDGRLHELLDSGRPADTGGVRDSGPAKDAGGDGGGDGGPDAGPPDAGCPPVDCTGVCGPVRNSCSGAYDQCGGCTGGLVCNLEKHQCLQPATDCQSLGAECGPVRNSCGERLDCGDCKDTATECDRNTHKCVACTRPSCADLGYGCGDAWLGCGPYTNVTHCGSCPSGYTCNTAYNICEPTCAPPPDADRCAAVGAQCGFTSNGCGGLASCGDCPAGKKCGARGIGNRCDEPEIPDECIAANRVCGPLQSACGAMLDCGSCSDPATVCWPDGYCAPPCVPRSCDKDPFLGKCGTDLFVGCLKPDGKRITIDCPCAGGLACTASIPGDLGTCVTPAGCAQFGASGGAGDACSNGASPAFPKGDGTNLACPCTGAGLCMKGGAVVSGSDTGQCCVNTVACAQNECNVTKKNACIGSDIVCACTTPGTHCNNSINTCEPDNGCAKFTDGAEPHPCSGGPSSAFPKGDGTNLTCPCTQPGAQCYGSTQSGGDWAPGGCCVNDTCPADTCAPVTNHCDSQQVPCVCTDQNKHCNAGTGICDPNLTCGNYNANGGGGDLCSNGPAFSNGATPPVLLTCACSGANLFCTDGASVVQGSGCGTVSGTVCAGDPDCAGRKCVNGRCADPCPIGTCCQNTVSCGNTCNNTTLKNSCTGDLLVCNCANGYYCDGGVCVPNKTCADYGANGRDGDPCTTPPNTNPAWPQQPPGATPALACGCTGGRICSIAGTPPHTAGAGEVGLCCTNTAACGTKCNNTLLHNSCSDAPLTCNCGANKHCNAPADGDCEDNATCGTYGANGAVGQPCSNGNDPADFPRYPGDGVGLTCKCSAGNCYKNYAVVSGATKGACCTPPPIPPGNVGDPCTSIHDDCTNTDLPRPCKAGNYCKAGVCAKYETCGGYGADGAQGHPCSDTPNPSWPRGDGTNLACRCSTAAPYANAFCDNGTCRCTPSSPANCGDNGRSDGCGGTMVSTCGGGEVCYQNACCMLPVCPAGNQNDPCGQISNCGQSVTCPCTQQYMTCGGGVPDRCGCTPKTQADCPVLGPGPHPDGCGGTVNCKA